MTKKEVVTALHKRIDWLVANDRPKKEIHKVTDLIVKTAQEIFDEEQADIFNNNLAKELEKIQK